MKVAIILLGFYAAEVPDISRHEAVMFLTNWYGTPASPFTSPEMKIAEHSGKDVYRFTIEVYCGENVGPYRYGGNRLEEMLTYCNLPTDNPDRRIPFLRAVLIRHLCPHFRMVRP